MELPVYLIGYMGAGKTTAGRLLADKLGWHFVNLDDAFKEFSGLSTADYIRTYGMDDFRRKEKDVVEELAELPMDRVIYATGGGYPCWEDNMDCLHELGTSIYIRWQPEHLAKRLALTDLSERPVLQGHTEPREPSYSQADYIIDAPLGECDEEADERIAEHLYHLIQSLRGKE